MIDGADWPRFGWTADLRPALADARARGAAVALATIVRLEGSAPRPVGTQMLFEGSRATGYFSGGCLEADVARHAAAVIAGDEPAWLVYGQGSPWIDIRLTCGGRMEIMVERIDADDAAVADLLAAAAARRPVTWISDGRTRRVQPGCDGPAVLDEAAGRIALPFAPVPRLLVAGGDPTALAIATLAGQAGWQALMLRADQAPADAALATVTGLAACLEQIGAADAWTAVAIATHEADLDHELLRAALATPAFYVGALGARARLPARTERLRAAGADTGRLQAPMGLAPTGKAPWEVAIAVLGEIMAAHQARAPQ